MEDRRLKRTFDLPTDAELARLERRYFKTKLWPRVVMLRRLRENNAISIAALAEATGRALPTGKAHLAKLRREGVEGLLGSSVDSCRLSESAIEELRSKLLEGRITSYREIREWVLEKYDVSYTDSGIRSLIQRELRLERSFVNGKHGGSGQSDDIVDAAFAKKLVRMVNRLPVDKDLKAWSAGFRDALFELFPNAVYIVPSIHVNVPTDGSPAKPRSNSVVYMESDEPKDSPAVHTMFTRNRAKESENIDTWVRKVLDVLGKLKKYDSARHTFEVRSVKLNGTVEVARILMLYRRGLGDENRDRKILDMMDPFLGFCISDALARQAQGKQADTVYSRASRAARMADLTERERDVFFAYVLGTSRNEIAAQLHMSDSSVKNHITAIHKKLKTRSLGEVLAHVNSPAQTDEDLHDREK